MQLHDFSDIHHHGTVDPEKVDSTIVCLSPLETASVPQQGFYSVGIHPWESDKFTPQLMQQVRTMAQQPNIVAIGETGIDTLKGASPEQQEEIFVQHAQLAEDLGLPLIIHAVHSFNTILQLHRQLKPQQLWVIHGFRGKPQLATQLTNQGIGLSFGKHYNPESFAATPPHLRFRETD